MLYQSKNITVQNNMQAASIRNYLILDFAANGNLKQFIQERNYLNEEQARNLCILILKILYIIHDQEFILSDLKPKNILFCDKASMKSMSQNSNIRLCVTNDGVAFQEKTDFKSIEDCDTS